MNPGRHGIFETIEIQKIQTQDSCGGMSKICTIHLSTPHKHNHASLVYVLVYAFLDCGVVTCMMDQCVMKGLSILKRNNMRVLIFTIGVVWICVLPLRSVSGQSCSTTSCFECVNLNCAWFSVTDDTSASGGECLAVCSVIRDAPCYGFEFYPTVASETLCATAESDISDWTMCSLALDCTSCVSLLQSDGVSPCSWYSEGSFCGSGACTDFGCGSNTTCDTAGTPVPAPSVSAPSTDVVPVGSLCNLNATTCEECLLATDYDIEVPDNCAWSTNRCVESCTEVPGYPCYSPVAYTDLIGNPKEICLLEAVATKDDDICMTATACTKCIDVLQSDNSTKCKWFERSGTEVTPYCGAHNASTTSVAQVDTDGCDLNGICGVSNCSYINAMINDDKPASAPVKVNTPTTSATSPTSGTERIVIAWSQQIAVTALVLMCFTLTNAT